MNAYIKKLMTYQSLKQLQQQGFSISKISNLTGINWRTIKSYLAMNLEEFNQFIESKSQRKRGLLPYESFVRIRLEKYPDTPAAQMHDWLKENFPDFPQTATRTLFNFVIWVRQKYNLPQIKPSRDYEMVEETAYGKQAQADFGVYNLRDGLGRRVKVFFIAMQLSRSRYKYVWFTDRHFTSELAITGHEQAFVFFQGITEQVVYDQDRVFIVDENKGDIILTDAFRAYTKERHFGLHFCRKSDPESKGKIENVVKYVKQNFLYNRCFCDIATLNEEVLQWLDRTANKLPHGTTKISPAAAWLTEQPYLAAFPALIQSINQQVYTVRKDNAISYKGNFYSLPLGTFKGKGTVVTVGVEESIWLVISNLQGDLLCKHMISIGSGRKVINSDHKRDKSVKIDNLIDEVCVWLAEDAEQGRQFLNAVRKAKPRYIRDQVLLFRDTIDGADKTTISDALTYCCQHRIDSAMDFKTIVDQKLQARASVFTIDYPALQKNPLNGTLPPAILQEPAKSSIEDYINLF